MLSLLSFLLPYGFFGRICLSHNFLCLSFLAVLLFITPSLPPCRFLFPSWICRSSQHSQILSPPLLSGHSFLCLSISVLLPSAHLFLLFLSHHFFSYFLNSELLSWRSRTNKTLSFIFLQMLSSLVTKAQDICTPIDSSL